MTMVNGTPYLSMVASAIANSVAQRRSTCVDCRDGGTGRTLSRELTMIATILLIALLLAMGDVNVWLRSRRFCIQYSIDEQNRFHNSKSKPKLLYKSQNRRPV
jgi:hypothetical protein